MAPRVTLHDLPGPKRAGELAKLLDHLHRSGRRVVVWVEDEGRRQVLDDYLWTFAKGSFLPHTTWRPGQEAPTEDPVVLLGEPGNPNRASVLVVGDELPPMEFAAGFEEVHDLVPRGEEGEARAARWRELAGEADGKESA